MFNIGQGDEDVLPEEQAHKKPRSRSGVRAAAGESIAFFETQNAQTNSPWHVTARIIRRSRFKSRDKGLRHLQTKPADLPWNKAH